MSSSCSTLHCSVLRSNRETPTTPNGVEFRGKFVTVAAFPIGIDPEKFIDALEEKSVQDRIAVLERKF